MADNPLVSIIIPAYNSGQFIAETLVSALAQTWANKEVIVIDNGSTDDTIQVLEQFKDQIIIIKTTQNKGAAAARNTGLAMAKGLYIQFLDADDLLSANKIESQLKVLNLSTTQLSLCKTVHFNNGDNHTLAEPLHSWFDKDMDDPVDFLVKLYVGEEVLPGYGGMATVHSWLTPTQLIKQAGPWNEELSVDDDGEFFARVILASDGIRYSDEALCYYRKFTDGRSLSSQKTLKALQSSIKAIDLKYQHLKTKFPAEIVDRIFARFYWWTGIIAYPEFKKQSAQCVNKAKQLGYKGPKYTGGPAGQRIAKLFGWKAARLLSDMYWNKK
ncbi:MAG: glycosyltransferase family 2 protein [Bacteroidota bacterium]